MSELRYRRPDEVTSAAAADRPQRQDSPYQQSRRTELPSDARPARDNSDDYDADADFKHPVPKPPGYLPDDNGGNATGRATLRWRGDRETRHGGHAEGTDLPRREDLAEKTLPREGEQGDTPQMVV